MTLTSVPVKNLASIETIVPIMGIKHPLVGTIYTSFVGGKLAFRKR